MHKDYIIRKIEQFVKALAAIVTARKAENYEETVAMIQNASKVYLETDISLLLTYTPDQVLEHFTDKSGNLDAERGVICADLLYELALTFDAIHHQEESLQIKVLCLNLYVTSILQNSQYRNELFFGKTLTLLDELKSHRLPGGIVEKLQDFQNFLDQQEA